MLKLQSTEMLEGDKRKEVRAANKAILEQCNSFKELFKVLMTTSRATMREAAVSCGMLPIRLDAYPTKEEAAKTCAEEILHVRRIRAFKALGHAERLEAMRRADENQRSEYAFSLTTEELEEYIAELHAGNLEEVITYSNYGERRSILVQLLSKWMDEHKDDETVVVTASEASTPNTETTENQTGDYSYIINTLHVKMTTKEITKAWLQLRYVHDTIGRACEKRLVTLGYFADDDDADDEVEISEEELAEIKEVLKVYDVIDEYYYGED